MSMAWAHGRVWTVWLQGSSVESTRPDAARVALTPPVALRLVHERLQRWVWALGGNPSDDTAWGGLEVLAGVHEHGDVCVHLGRTMVALSLATRTSIDSHVISQLSCIELLAFVFLLGHPSLRNRIVPHRTMEIGRVQ